MDITCSYEVVYFASSHGFGSHSDIEIVLSNELFPLILTLYKLEKTFKNVLFTVQLIHSFEFGPGRMYK